MLALVLSAVASLVPVNHTVSNLTVVEGICGQTGYLLTPYRGRQYKIRFDF